MRTIQSNFTMFEDGQVTNCQDFINSAILKYNKISASEKGFKGSVHTVQEDTVALITINTKKNPSKSHKRKTDGANEDNEPNKKRKPKIGNNKPPQLKHYKDADGTKLKVSDTKKFKGKTFHYCDALTHRYRYRIKWHTHESKDCSVRKKCLISKSDNTDSTNTPSPEVNANEVKDLFNDSAGDESLSTSTDTNALLQTTMNLVTDNDIVRDYITNAINAASVP